VFFIAPGLHVDIEPGEKGLAGCVAQVGGVAMFEHFTDALQSETTKPRNPTRRGARDRAGRRWPSRGAVEIVEARHEGGDAGLHRGAERRR